MEKQSLHALRADFLTSTSVSNALRLMRENFIRTEQKLNSDLFHPRGLSSNHSSSNSSGSLDSSHRSTFEEDGSDATARGLEAFTESKRGGENGGSSNKSSAVALRLLSRHSSERSFDDQDDSDIMKFLAISRSSSLSTSSSSNDHLESPLDVTDENDENEAAEDTALLVQETKLKQLRTNRLGQFVKGMKKEHEVIYFLQPRSKGFSHSSRMLMEQVENSPVAGIKPSSTRRLGGFDEEQNKKNAQHTIMSSLESTSLEPIVEDDEYSSPAHRATLLLCQVVTFLGLAVFFFNDQQSFIDPRLWSSILSADPINAINTIIGQIFQGIAQVLMTLPITFCLAEVFKQLDNSRTARMLFETRVATNRSKFLISGISQNNAVGKRSEIVP